LLLLNQIRGEHVTGYPTDAEHRDAPELTRRERDVLAALCRPELQREVFAEPASVRQIAEALVVTDAAVKQHLVHLYDKFEIRETSERRRRRVSLAREAIRLGVVAVADRGVVGARSERVARDSLRAGNEAFAQSDWETAAELLSAADSVEPLGPGDLERLAESALWADRHEQSFAAHQRAYQEYWRLENPRRAVFVALMLVIHYAVRLELAAADGWFGKARRLLEPESEGAEHGWLALVLTLFSEVTGEWDTVYENGVLMHEIGCRHRDPDLQALGLTFQGLVLTRRGQIADGTQLLDEAMASATGGELGMMATAIVYSRMMCACLDLHDFRRAAEWTDVVESCRATSGLGGFPGDRRTHRAAVLIRRGAWAEGEKEALRAVEATEAPHTGVALYELGEVRLCHGDLDGAAETFLHADELGFLPQPGMSLLRLARTEIPEAVWSINTALGDATLDRLARSTLLPAQVEIVLAAGDTETARSAVSELEAIAQTYDTPALGAAAEHSRGQLELATGDPTEAAHRLTSAQRLWRHAEAPYEAGQAQALLAEAHLARGDHQSGLLELRAARAAFERLDAALDMERIDRRIHELPA
jgi:hypothetical protein